jgi:hypothetical protein
MSSTFILLCWKLDELAELTILYVRAKSKRRRGGGRKGTRRAAEIYSAPSRAGLSVDWKTPDGEYFQSSG